MNPKILQREAYSPSCDCTHHAAEVWNSGVFVGVRVEQHLGVRVEGQIGFYLLPMFAQKMSNSLYFRLRLRKGTTVGVVAGVKGSTFIWRLKEKAGGEYRRALPGAGSWPSRWQRGKPFVSTLLSRE